MSGAITEEMLAREPLPDPGPASRDTFVPVLNGVAQGVNQVAAAKNQNRGSVATNQTYTPPALASYNSPTSLGNAAVYDNALDRCVQLGGDGQSVYFQNNCNASLTIMEVQRGQGGPGSLNCGPGSRCTFGIFGVGYTTRETYTYAVCPQGDYIESAPGVQWSGSGPFRCRSP
jgi:hypothetical protein